MTLSRALALTTLIAALGVGAPVGATSGDSSEVLLGRLDVVWGDPQPGSGLPALTVLTLTEDSGERTELAISDELARAHGGFMAWNGRRIRAHLAERDPWLNDHPRPGTRRVLALTVLEDEAAEEATRGGVSGSHPWVSILCKFSDIGTEPKDLAFFQNMYSNTFGGLDHYWREQSYGIIDVAGSTAIDWVTLPGTQASYLPAGNADLGTLFADCTAAADPFVDFANGGNAFSGINQMFNDSIGCCAWGGGQTATLDGVTKFWRVTWEPPWSYADEGVIAHEMGHGFGLPHSNNWDGDGSPYDSPWDVMSAAQAYGVDHGTYGLLGKHSTAHHKNLLGWFAPEEILTVEAGSTATATIDAIALASTPNYRMAKIPIPMSSTWYTVEVRDFIGYDASLPGNAVIISHVDTSRQQPAWAYDADVPPADFSDNEGTMFRVGETFMDEVNEISVSVDMATDNGFEITISVQAGDLFSDGFESGSASAWTP